MHDGSKPQGAEWHEPCIGLRTMTLDRSSLDRISLELDTSGLNLKQLYYFHAVATEGSIAAAAKRLRVTQPTVSEQVKNLELFLDCSLFERRPEGMRLNNMGRRVYSHTQVMFRATRRLIQEVNPKISSDRWVLEVAVCTTVSRTFAADRFLGLFRLPDIAPRIRHGSYDQFLYDLVRGDIDLLLSENVPAEPDRKHVALKALRQSPLVSVAAPEMAEKVDNYPADLGKIPFVQYGKGSRYRWEIESYLMNEGVAVEVLAEVDDVALLSVAAETGLCWVAVPRDVVATEIEAGKLVELGPVDNIASTVYAHYAQVRTPDVVLQAIEALSGEGE
jgi:LysR family transcriptional activator of nhaA